VAAHTAAWVRGLQRAGVAACAKHFPGHGDTTADSHVALPIAAEDPRVRALEPFKSAIAAGVRAIMSAHIVAPALDDLPATISPRIMTALLRHELGFAGVAVSDGLDMAGLTATRGIPEAAVLAIAAGCDALVVGGGPNDAEVVDAIVDAIVAAVESGRLAERRLAEAAGRVGAVVTAPSEHLHPDAEVGLAAARLAVCADGDVSIHGKARLVHLESPGSIAAGDVPWGLGPALADCGVRHTESGRTVIEVRDLQRRPEHQAAVDSLLRQHPDAILVEMGVPAQRPARARAYLATHGSARVCAIAAVELMTGARA
jgi:beta-N-acetylhexosaminidase